MEIKTEKQQLLEKREELDILIMSQDIRVKNAEIKCRRKRIPILSIFFLSSIETYEYMVNKERKIRENLKEYDKEIQKRIASI